MDEVSTAGSPASFHQAVHTELWPVDRLRPAHVDAWTRLAHGRATSAPFMDVAWISAYQGTCMRGSLQAVIAWRSDRLVGLAPLEQVRQWLICLPVRVLRSVTVDWLNRYEFLAEQDDPEVLGALCERWLSATRCDVIRLDLVPSDSPTLAAVRRAAGQWKVVISSAYASPRRLFPGAPATWDTGLKSKFKANLRNREKRLARRGTVRFEVHRGSGHAARAQAEFYELENRGWKGERRTSILDRPVIKRFYDALVASAAESVWIPVLYVDDRPVAAQLVRAVGDTVYLLKVGYDPAYAIFSPGQLLTARMMALCMEEGYRIFDFLGEAVPWKMDWEPEVMGQCQLTLYAPTFRGRLAYGMMHVLPQWLRRRSLLRRLVRGIRRRSPE